jgi:GNAT superfamily N-acetyltransferase
VSGDDVAILRGGAELLDEVRPLWLALRNHHSSVAPDLGPVREDDDSWHRRREQYEGWLAADPRAFVLLARRQGRAIGYAFVRVEAQGSPTWQGDGDAADLETLSLLPEARGSGTGAKLVALVREEVQRQGYAALHVTAVATNHDALRFYEREGFAPAFIVYRDTPRRP